MMIVNLNRSQISLLREKDKPAYGKIKSLIPELFLCNTTESMISHSMNYSQLLKVETLAHASTYRSRTQLEEEITNFMVKPKLEGTSAT